MKNKFIQFFGLIIICSGINACSTEENAEIDSQVILKYTSEIPKNAFVSNFDSIQYNLKKDTLERNIPFTFRELIVNIQKEFQLIDTIKTNKNTKLYLKSILLADVVYAGFSLQMFGNSYGLSNDRELKKDWSFFSIEKQYNLGNQNKVSANCGPRTIFYKKLVDKLLKIPVRDTSIVNIHTYPIVEIGGRDYIVDPYEPFIFLNQKNNKILTYQELSKGVGKINFRKSKRSFGTTHSLISNYLNERLIIYEGDLKYKLISFIQADIVDSNKKIPDCYLPIFEKSPNVYPVNNEYNLLAIEVSNQRNMGTILNQMTFYNSYFGISCNN